MRSSEQDEGADGALDADADEAAQHRRDLDDAEARLLPVVLPREHDPEVDRLVAEVRKRVAGIDRQRRQHREDVGAKALVEGRELERSQLLRADDDDACPLHRRENLGVEELVGRVNEGVDARADGHELLVREQPVRRKLGDRPQDLSLEPGDPDHEELVEVGEEDPQELEALEERYIRRAGLGEDAGVELQPRGSRLRY